MPSPHPVPKASPFMHAPCYGTCMIRTRPRLLIAVLPFLAAACSTAANYPSLALRDVERGSGQAMPVAGEAATPAPALPPAGADLATRLDGLVAAARAADQQFQTNRPAAERAVATAGATTSDSWSSASVALAELEASRSQAMVALAELDTLYVDARSAGPAEETPNARAISAARDQVGSWVAEQDKVIASLSARLKN